MVAHQPHGAYHLACVDLPFLLAISAEAILPSAVQLHVEELVVVGVRHESPRNFKTDGHICLRSSVASKDEMLHTSAVENHTEEGG